MNYLCVPKHLHPRSASLASHWALPTSENNQTIFSLTFLETKTFLIAFNYESVNWRKKFAVPKLEIGFFFYSCLSILSLCSSWLLCFFQLFLGDAWQLWSTELTTAKRKGFWLKSLHRIVFVLLLLVQVFFESLSPKCLVEASAVCIALW